MPRSATVFLAIICLVSGHSVSSQGLDYSVIHAFPQLPAVEKPVDLQFAPGHPDLLFIAEQPGRIQLFENDSAVSSLSVFLDITDRVHLAPSWEEGLLGFAFDPLFADNGHVFVYYTAPPAAEGEGHRSIIARYSSTPINGIPFADPSSELIILELEQLGPAHNGGQVVFGPDNFLYVSFGDGHWGSDPFGTGQDAGNLFGSIIRIDVSNVDDRGYGRDTVYSIPSDNPFVNADNYRPEIWAYGLRNPWRFSFDPVTERGWIGDVGEAWIEEINIIEAGGNYGWSTMEGSTCFNPPPEGALPCNDPSLLLPIWEYTHANGDKSITGGFVYRGPTMPELQGKYVYGDFISGRIWALDVQWPSVPGDAPDVSNELLVESGLMITTFGVDADQELYFLDYLGHIHRLVSPSSSGQGPDARMADAWIKLSGPNPVRLRTRLAFGTGVGGNVQVAIFDVAGRKMYDLYTGHLEPQSSTSILVDGSRLAAGLYVVRMTVDGHSTAITRLTIVP